MTRQSKIVLAIVAYAGAVAVLILAVQFYLITRHVVNLTDEQVREMIGKELPRGTARPPVKKFLASKGWPHGDGGATTLAIILDAERWFLIQKDIQIQFHFDADDKLASYELRGFLKGP